MIAIVLHPQLRRNILAYVDDIVVKTVQTRDHVGDLAETFANLRAVNLTLNPEKCVFGIHKGKVLECLVSTKGIDANPENQSADRNARPSFGERCAKINRESCRSQQIHSQGRRKKFAFLSSSQKLQEISMVRNSETSFSRTQGLFVEYD
jgi:hypothetical protein